MGQINLKVKKNYCIFVPLLTKPTEKGPAKRYFAGPLFLVKIQEFQALTRKKNLFQTKV